MDNLHNFFKEHNKIPPENLWKNILKRVNQYDDPVSSRSESMAKKSKIVFSISLLVVIAAIAVSLVLFKSKTTHTTKTKPQKAYVTFLMGNAEMETQQGNIIKLKVGNEVTGARVLRTRDKSRIDIKLTSGSVFTISENSEMKLMAYLSSKSNQEKTNIDLFRGKLVVEPNKVQDDGNFDVNTPTAVAGVRGTRFSVAYNQEAESTRIAVEHGKVEVKRKINIDVNKTAKTKIFKAIKAETVVDKGNSVVISREDNERISEELNKDIDKIQQKIAQNQDINDIGAINKAKSLSGLNSLGLTAGDKNIFSELKTHREPVSTVKVAINNNGGILYINGTETNTPTYTGEFKPGAKIDVKIEKKGFATFSKEYTVPDSAEVFKPEITLKKLAPKKPVMVTVTKTKKIKLERIVSKYNTSRIPASSIVESGNFVYFATSKGELVSVNMGIEGGRVDWKLPVNSNIDTTPVVKSSLIYFGARNGYIYAVNKNSGKVLWSKKLGTMIFKSKITVKSSRIYFGTIEGNVYSVNAKTGNVIWKKNLEGGIWGSVAVGNSYVYAGCEDGKVYALNRNSGLNVWAADLEARVIAPVVIANRRVVAVNYRGKAFGIKSNDGKILWSKDLGVVKIKPAVSGPNVYMGVKNKVIGMKAGNGEIIFTKTLSGAKVKIEIQSRRLFVTSGKNYIYELSAAGEIIWQHTIQNKIFGHAAGNSKFMFAISDKGQIIKLRRVVNITKNYKVRILKTPDAMKNR